MEKTKEHVIDRRQRLQIPRQPLPKQDPTERIRNFDEVYLPIDLDTARLEATRCIQCPAAPCVKACPLHNDIPGALLKLEQGDVIGAANTFRLTSNEPEMCGRLCPQESLCEGHCVVGKKALPVAIGRLEVFVTDYQRRHEGIPMPPVAPPTGGRVAVIGSGPAGLTVAEELARCGHTVTVFEYWPRPGGILRYGIPNFKFDKSILDEKLAQLERMGIEFITNVRIGADVTVDDLLCRGFDAVFLGVGAPKGNNLGVPGEDLQGIYSATEFLVRGNLPPAELPVDMREPLHIGRRVVVIGGGDTSMDCVRTAVRLGAEEVVCVYRRTDTEMRGRAEERMHAIEERVRFMYLTIPLRFSGDGDGLVRRAEFQKMRLDEPDESGRRRPVPVVGSEFTLEVDTVVIAIGYSADPLVAETTPRLNVDRYGLFVVDPESGLTSRRAIYAGGDAVRGADYVVNAIADGRRAAAAIHDYLCSHKYRSRREE